MGGRGIVCVTTEVVAPAPVPAAATDRVRVTTRLVVTTRRTRFTVRTGLRTVWRERYFLVGLAL